MNISQTAPRAKFREDLLRRGESRLRLQTIVRLRWLAVLGQSATVVVVYWLMGIDLPIGACLAVISLSAWLNVALRLRYPASQRLPNHYAFLMLGYDILQLGALLYLTGGLENPFAFLLIAPFLLKPYGIFILTTWAVMTVAAIGLNLTLGYAGQISLAQAAFVGIGAYITAWLTTRGWSFWPTLGLTGVACFVTGWLLGYPALRLQHHYLAFVTLAFNTLVYLVFRNEEWLTGGIYGITNVPRPSLAGWSLNGAHAFYYFCLASLALVSLATWWLIRSPWGRAFVALRENPMRALSLGVDTRRYTLMAFALGASLGGVSGALYAPLVQFIDPTPFALGLSLNLLLMVVVGGSGYFFGPFLGAVVAVLLPEWLRFAQGYYLMGYAVLVMLLMMFSPSGLLGLADRLLSPTTRAAPAAAREMAR